MNALRAESGLYENWELKNRSLLVSLRVGRNLHPNSKKTVNKANASKNKEESQSGKTSNSSDDAKARNDFATSERKRWQNKSDAKKTVDAVGCIPRDILMVGSVSDSHGADVEWVLDSACDIHVCNRQDLLSHLHSDSTHVFQGYDGNISGDDKVGNVQIRVRNHKQSHRDVVLQLDVLYRRSAHDNLLSLDVMEKDGWTLNTGLCEA
ncbi:hypothetical protein PHMEG_00025659 [Phytophthora megakarya]|uniref:Retrovirus-related Pol polyprotein from transposon TNT 1-94-like beta-barrel domain-containing protein n=1 Tax=Phytophthora megakarya TaxID=4795 RepID=A0A225VE27_9STRA|nr:hypothetical protein PHMEG_00025659 [Phytophthora megakarya]